MTRIAIDGHISEVSAEEPQGRVTELVRQAITNLPSSRLITKIVVDGRAVSTLDLDDEGDTHSFRDLEIRTVDREVWAVNGLDTALTSIERVQKSLIRAAEMFREEDKARANRFFVQCVDGLENFYEAILITRNILRLDFNQIEIDGFKLSTIENDFSTVLRVILELQERQDWTGLADKIEYELITNLSFWTVSLRQLKLSKMSNA